MHTIGLDEHTLAVIQGFKDVRVENPDRFLKNLREGHPDLMIQALNADYVAGFEHLQMILQQAWEAKTRGQSYAKRFEIDLLLRIACEAQISEAVKVVGIKRGRQDLVLVAVGDVDTSRRVSQSILSLGVPSDKVILRSPEKDKSLLKRHGLSSGLLKATIAGKDALPLLLAERAALLGIKEE